MGLWKLVSAAGEVTPFTEGTLYGHNFKVTFTLEYKASLVGSFTEPPKLDWHEKFIMIEHHKRERWVFEKNMYEHNPASNTLIVWAKRYIEAYDRACGQPNALIKGSSTLLTSAGTAVTRAQLGTAASPLEKANAVRNYLKSKSGRLVIVIHDIPSLNAPGMWQPPAPDPVPAPAVWQPALPTNGGRVNPVAPAAVAPAAAMPAAAMPPVPMPLPPQIPEHKERLLLFNVGVVNSTTKWVGSQYVMVSANLPQAQWAREGSAVWSRADLPLPPGYTDVEPPDSVSRVRAPLFAAGECW